MQPIHSQCSEPYGGNSKLIFNLQIHYTSQLKKQPYSKENEKNSGYKLKIKRLGIIRSHTAVGVIKGPSHQLH